MLSCEKLMMSEAGAVLNKILGKNSFVFLLGIIFLVSCSTTNPIAKNDSSDAVATPATTQTKDQDWGPVQEIDMSHVPDAVPKYEPRTIAGNRNPYDVFGKMYNLLQDERIYKERGIASWYGYKFNGERTSNGEVYDMFAMTAAHKSLPIPSYVRVTNLNNHKTVVVRVNDRGPFHENRIIDLSYAAAQRLGITRDGTGYVEVEIIVPADDPRTPLKKVSAAVTAAVVKPPLAPTPTAQVQNIQALQSTNKFEAPALDANNHLPAGTYLQVGAFGVENSANQLAANLRRQLSFPVIINDMIAPQKLFRVRVGPFKDLEALQKAREQLLKLNIVQMHTVYQ